MPKKFQFRRNVQRHLELGFGISLTAAVLAILGPAPATAQERFYHLQLKHGGQYLDADHCTAKIGLNPGSTWENGACQLWRLVPAGDGWSRLQLKHGGQYLDADHCTSTITLNPGSTWENGACQLWRLVPELSCLSWKWRKRSSVKIAERTYEKGTKALHRRGEGGHSEAAPIGQGSGLGLV